MNRKIFIAAWLCVASALSISPVLAQGENAGPVDLDALDWTELSNGVKIAVFMGNPKELGPYGSRARQSEVRP
jgi:hypothetical protein